MQEGYHPDAGVTGATAGMEYLYDDPRRPYYCQNLAPSPARTSWHHSTFSGGSGAGASVGGSSSSNSGSNADNHARKPTQADTAQQQRRNQPLAPSSSGITTSSGFSKTGTGSFGSSSLASVSLSYEDADYALPFANGSTSAASHLKNSSSFTSSSAIGYSDSEGSKYHPHGIHGRAYAGPDRYVKTVLTYASYMPSNRRGNRSGNGGSGAGVGGGQADRPLSFKSMARGPEGSNRVVLAANDGKKVSSASVCLSSESIGSLET